MPSVTRRSQISAFKLISLIRRDHLSDIGSLSLVLSNASEHYVRAWTPRVGGRTLAEGETPCLWCSMPQRGSVAPMYVFILVLHVLAGAYRFLVITDNIFLYLDSRFSHRTQATLRKHRNHAPIVFRIFFRLFVTCSRFCPGVDVDARQRHKQLPGRHVARAQDQDDLGLSLPTGACLVLVSDTWFELCCL